MPFSHIIRYTSTGPSSVSRLAPLPPVHPRSRARRSTLTEETPVRNAGRWISSGVSSFVLGVATTGGACRTVACGSVLQAVNASTKARGNVFWQKVKRVGSRLMTKLLGEM